MKAAQKLYKHCTGEELKSGVVYMVAYVNCWGDWVMDEQEFKTESAATKHGKKIAKEKALNGRVSVRVMPKSKTERSKLNSKINKF